MIELNKIYNEDCLETMAKMPDNFCDIIITSPPYNMRLRTRGGKYVEREKAEHFSKKYDDFPDALPMEDYKNFHTKALMEMLRVSSLVFWNIQIVTGSKDAIFQIIGSFYNKIRDIAIWDKGHGQPAMNDGVMNRGYELFIILENDNRDGRTFRKYTFGRGTLQDIWRFGRGGNGEIEGHSATFPTNLVLHILNNFSNENDIIYDPFMGSGTTAIASIKLKRNWIGSEISSNYCDIANKRIEQELSQMKLF